MSNLRWPPIVAEAARIVESYETGVTLRQLFYRLVAAEILPNTDNAYSTLSDRTAAARRAGTFPDLLDLGRSIHRANFWDGPEAARDALREQYRRDRTEGQPCTVYFGVEKRGMVAQLEQWFGETGTPILSLGGYSSQTFKDDVRGDAERGRDRVLLYAGDFDPSGWDIPRDFVLRVGNFDVVRRIALTAEQIAAYDIPTQPLACNAHTGKPKDPRGAQFIEQHGDRVAEMDALEPEVLHALYQAALDDYFDADAYADCLAREDEEREQL